VLAEQNDEWTEGRHYMGLDLLRKARITPAGTTTATGRSTWAGQLGHGVAVQHRQPVAGRDEVKSTEQAQLSHVKPSVCFMTSACRSESRYVTCGDRSGPRRRAMYRDHNAETSF
jgi:hypothetical protein